MPDKPHTVFVSHAHADNELCDRYVAALKKRGLDVWYDHTNMQGGQRLGREIETQLERRTALIVLLTSASVVSYWVDMEVSAFRDLAAHDISRLLLPVRIADCPVPLLMRGLFWIDAVALGFDAAVDALAVVLGAPISSSVAKWHGPRLPMSPSTPPTEAYQDASAFIVRGNTRYTNFEFDEALAEYDRALALDPNNADACIAKGNALFMLDRYIEALVEYDRMLAVEPFNVRAWVAKSAALRGMERNAEALLACAQALTLDPNNAEAWASNGDILYELGRNAEAVTAYNRALTLDSTSTRAWYGKSRAQLLPKR